MGVNSGLLQVGDTMDPDEVKVPKARDDWVDSDTNIAKGEPNFEKVYNPGRCAVRSVPKHCVS